MDKFDPFFIAYIIIPIIIAVIATFYMVGMGYVAIDAINTRSLECQNVVVENTSSINDGYGITFFVNVNNTRCMVLDTANDNNIKRWGKIEPGDVVYMKLGKQTAVFC